MASFTDNTQALSTFNPYIQQLPVEAMVKVGMQKQQQYDEGIQKIQTNIDNIAGLDVIRDVDKAYLQSKINELGSNLKVVGAGDFSNFQLVNSVNGMTNQIAKDSNVQEAVGSTARVRKEQANLETARKAGKSSVQNEAYFNKDLNKWVNSSNLKEGYNGRYIEYTDIDKKLREVADKVHELDNSIDIPFKRDSAGNILKGSDGKPMIDDAMLSISTKGKPASKLLANFYSSLNENDQQQLHIDSWYHYRGATADTFKTDATKNYQDNKKILSDSLVTMSTEILTNSKLSSVDKSKIEAQINDVNTRLYDGSLEKELNTQLEQIGTDQDADSYKYKLYTQKYLTKLANDTSYESIKQEYKNNPYFQADMQKKDLQFKYDNARREQMNSDRAFGWDQTKFYTLQAEKMEKAALDAQEKNGSQAIGQAGRISSNVNPPSLNDIDRDTTNLKNDINKLTSTYAPTIVDGRLKDNKQRATYLNYLSTQYATNPGFLSKIKDANLKEYLEKRRSLEIQLGQKQNLGIAASGASKKYDVQLDDLFKSTVGINNTQGKQLHTAKDLFTLSKDIEKFYKTTEGGVSPTTGASASTTTFDTHALYAKYKGTNKEAIVRAYIKHYNGDAMNSSEKILFDRTQQIKFKFDNSARDILKQKLKFQSDYLAQRMPERQTIVGSLNKDNKADMAHINALIVDKRNEFANGGIDVDSKKDYNPDTIDELMKSKNAGYTIEKHYDGSANVIVSSGSQRQIIKLNSNELGAYFPNYAKNSPVNEIKYAVLASPKHTTNLQGGHDASNAVNARYSGYDLPNLGKTLAPLVRYDIEGSPFNDGSGNDKYQVRMYVNDNGHWKTDVITDYVTDAGLPMVFEKIGPATVQDFLSRTK